MQGMSTHLVQELDIGTVLCIMELQFLDHDHVRVTGDILQ